jgi:hypothetical protein
MSIYRLIIVWDLPVVILPWLLSPRRVRHAQPSRQVIGFPVEGPRHGVGCERGGKASEQCHIDRPVARLLKLLPLYPSRRLLYPGNISTKPSLS